MDTAVIPNRPVFRAQEVCDLAQVEPYVLRSWEAEFPELGVAKTADGPRVYRRADVERVLRIKHLLFVDGLTMAGARRRITEEGGGTVVTEAVPDADVAALIDRDMRRHLQDVRKGLHWILGLLGGDHNGAGTPEFVLTAAPGAGRASRPRPRPVARRAASKGRVSKPAKRVKPVVRKRGAKGKKR